MVFKAHVRNGRIVLDEPTDLPEGSELELMPIEDELDDDERARLEEALSESEQDLAAGRFVAADELLTRLRQQ